jgi:hypothetical protein
MTQYYRDELRQAEPGLGMRLKKGIPVLCDIPSAHRCKPRARDASEFPLYVADASIDEAFAGLAKLPNLLLLTRATPLITCQFGCRKVKNTAVLNLSTFGLPLLYKQ